MTPVWRAVRASSRSAILQFVCSGLLATAVIAVLAVAVSRRAGTAEAIRDARELTRVVGQSVVAPEVTRAVEAGDPAALRRLDRIIRERVMVDGVVRVKLWDASGRVVYSDKPALIGRRFPLSEDDLASLRNGTVEAEVSNLSKSENRLERGSHKLLEVYLPIRTPDGDHLLFETYQRFAAVSASGHRMWLAFAPALLGGLLLLQLVNLPLAGSLARRLRRGQEQREALLQRALEASDTERRAIAADLHDGVVQDLVAVAYTLAGHADRVAPLDEEASAALRDGAVKTRATIRSLRTLLVDIYPPRLQQAGLAAAVTDLATAYSVRGLATTVAVPESLCLSDSAAHLLFRCAQEGLRNTHKHAAAAAATVTVRDLGEDVVMDIEDDGHGFDSRVLDTRPAEGHFGVRALADLVTDAGGRLEVLTAPGRGTTLRVRLRR
jgi:signal transduction histidine kinase